MQICLKPSFKEGTEMWPFSKRKEASIPKILPFKDGQGFFEYQCQFGMTDIKPRRGIIGIVKIVSVEPTTGIQNVTLQIAAPDGGFEAHSQTASATGDKLAVGDIVIWVPIERDAILAAAYKKDLRSSWLGLVVAKVAPEIDLETDQFNLLCKYA